MKKLLFLILILFSCEKPKEEKTPCWTCTTMKYFTANPGYSQIYDEFETCDKGTMLLWDGKRVLERQYAGGPIIYSYITSCK